MPHKMLLFAMLLKRHRLVVKRRSIKTCTVSITADNDPTEILLIGHTTFDDSTVTYFKSSYT